MDNEENKVSLEKNSNDLNNNDRNNDLLSQDKAYEQQPHQNIGNDSYSGNGYQENPYNTGNGNIGNGSWNNAGYQDINRQGSSKSTFSPSGFAIASLVLGILSLVCCCFWYVSGIFAVIGLVFSIIVLVKHKPGKGLAIAGLICSAIGLIIAVIMGIMIIYIGANMSVDDYKKIIDQINSME